MLRSVDGAAALYTVTLHGGEAVILQFSGNPGFEHRGGTSVAHLVLNEQEVDQLKGLGVLYGITVRVRLMEGQAGPTGELPENDLTWRTVACPTCPWFEPNKPGNCGLTAWPSESVKELRRTSTAHVEAEKSCPA